MHTKVSPGSGYSDKNPTPGQSPVFCCLSQQRSCALPTHVQGMPGIEGRAKCSVGNEWWKISLFLFLMIICSWFGSLPTPWYSLRMSPWCVLRCGMGQGGMEWGGMGYDGACVGADFLIQECWMLLPLMAAAFYCRLQGEGNLRCPARCLVVGCHITC